MREEAGPGACVRSKPALRPRRSFGSFGRFPPPLFAQYVREWEKLPENLGRLSSVSKSLRKIVQSRLSPSSPQEKRIPAHVDSVRMGDFRELLFVTAPEKVHGQADQRLPPTPLPSFGTVFFGLNLSGNKRITPTHPQSRSLNKIPLRYWR